MFINKIKDIVDRVKKGARDVGSGAKDIARNNPEALTLAAIIGLGGIPGGKPFLGGKIGLPSLKGFKIPGLDAVTKAIGGLDQVISTQRGEYTKEGDGILGTAQDILGGIFSKDADGNSKVGSGILPLIASFLMKKELEKEKARALGGPDYSGEYGAVDELFGSKFGIGSNPNKNFVFEDLQYNPKDDKRYDFYEDGVYKDYVTDDEGNITNYQNEIGVRRPSDQVQPLQSGGITNAGMLKQPFNPGNQISGILTRAYGGGTDPEIFDPRMSGNQMMNQIKKNPGITEFFPPQFGEITGPGGPKDDKIPAMLSDGEFVMTAKAVDNAGGPKAMYNLMNKLDPESSKGKGII